MKGTTASRSDGRDGGHRRRAAADPNPPGQRRGRERGSEGQDCAGPHNRRTGRRPPTCVAAAMRALVRRGGHPVSANSAAVVGAVAAAGTAPARTIDKRAGIPRTCAAAAIHGLLHLGGLPVRRCEAATCESTSSSKSQGDSVAACMWMKRRRRLQVGHQVGGRQGLERRDRPPHLAVRQRPRGSATPSVPLEMYFQLL
jgi:hypothetical protein